MRSEETSTYTRNCLLLGPVVGFTFDFLAKSDISEEILQYLFGTSSYVLHPDMVPITLIHGLWGLLCLGICWLSSRLDFYDPDDDWGGVIFGLAIVWILGVVPVLGFAFLENIKSSDPSQMPFAPVALAFLPDVRGDRTFFSDIVVPLIVWIVDLFLILLQLVLFLATTVLLFLMSQLAFGLTFAAFLCLPRALIFSFTAHKLRRPVAQAKGTGMISADQVISGVGQKSTSTAHATALRKDVDAQLAEARRVAEELKEKERRLSKAMHQDTERLKGEAELLNLLEEIDSTKVKIKELMAAKRKQTQ